MKYKIFFVVIISVLLSNLAMATTSIDQELSAINDKINVLHDHLAHKKEAKEDLNKLVQSSQVALQDTTQLLSKLKTQNNIRVEQLNKYQANLVDTQQKVTSLKTDLELLIKKTYKEKIALDYTQDNFLSNSDKNQKKINQKYLQIILANQIDAYNKMSSNLNQITASINSLNTEIEKQKHQIEALEKKKQTLEKTTVSKKQEYVRVNTELTETELQLEKLNTQQSKITTLISQIKEQQEIANKKAKEQATRALAAKSKSRSKTITPVASDEDEPSKPMTANLSKVVVPVSGPILVRYSKNGKKSNGVLVSSISSPVVAISRGKVAYVGKFANLGNVVVVDHGSNYMSIYSGLIPSIKIGETVEQGRELANSGDNDNQPMGGVYFELRHNGSVIDSNYIFN